MKRPLFERRSGRWWVISIAAHAVIIALLAQIAFKYPLGQLLGILEPKVTQERLHFVALPKPPTEHSGAGSSAATSASPSAPAALPRPTSIPTRIPAIVPRDSSRSVAAGGTGTGLDASGSSLATGLVPRQPDSRIELNTGPVIRTPRTVAEDVDSIVRLTVGIVNDSIAIAAAQRKPGDWTVKGKDGKVWGWDQQGNIRLGKFVIPGALLAMLPLNAQSPVSPIEARTAAWIREDIQRNAQRVISEDEFREAVKRIRERKERERRQKQLADSKGSNATP